MLDKLNYGDIVTLAEYPTQYFRIKAFQTNEYDEENKPTRTEYWLDLTCAHSGGYTMAYADEVTVVALADEADDFLAAKPSPIYGGFAGFGGIPLASIFDFMDERIYGGVVEMIKKKPEVAKEPTKQERIDALLDERNDVGSTDDFIPTQDAEYKQRRLVEIDAQLSELMAE